MNQHTIAIDENNKAVLIDENGNDINNLRITANMLSYYGRTVDQ